MVLFPNAKINIGLNILHRREDGYHEIETLFYPLGLKDVLEYVVTETGKVRFESSGLNLGIIPEDNLILKVYRMLQEEHALPGMDIHLHKIIPFGAGLGGGSADAAFFLKSLNEYLELGIRADKLAVLARRIGADCAFFLENKPSYATGAGEILTPAGLNLKGTHLLLIKPNFGIGTREAYSGVVPSACPLNFREEIEGGIPRWKQTIKNDFELTLFARFPELGVIKTGLMEAGAAYSAMSGSGSAVYGLFSGKPAIKTDDYPSDYFIWQEELI